MQDQQEIDVDLSTDFMPPLGGFFSGRRHVELTS